MCPICISAAALAWAGTGSAGGLAAFVAVKLRLKRPPEAVAPSESSLLNSTCNRKEREVTNEQRSHRSRTRPHHRVA